MKTTIAAVLLATSSLTANAQIYPTVVVNQPPVACSRPQQNNGYYLDNLFRDTQQKIDYATNTGLVGRYEGHDFYSALDRLKERRFRMTRRDGYLDPYEQQSLVADLQMLNSRIPIQRYGTPRHDEHHNYPNNGYPNTYPNNYPNGSQNGYPNNGYPNTYPNNYPNGSQNRHEDGHHDDGRHEDHDGHR